MYSSVRFLALSGPPPTVISHRRASAQAESLGDLRDRLCVVNHLRYLAENAKVCLPSHWAYRPDARSETLGQRRCQRPAVRGAARGSSHAFVDAFMDTHASTAERLHAEFPTEARTSGHAPPPRSHPCLGQGLPA
jgi:hypothetical protein